jgi:hypothetical protein
LEEAFDDPRFAPHPLHRAAQFVPEMRHIEAAQITELDAFELLPEALARIQVRCIRRQALQVKALRRTIGQERLDDTTPVNGGSVPDDDHAAWDFTQQMLQKRDHVGRVERVVLATEIELALRRDGTDGREVLAGPPLPQDGGLADRRIRADDTGQGIEPGFVYKEDAVALGLRPLSRAGQVSWRQRAIAASSRWRARRIGFCGLQRSSWHRRPT